MSQENVDAVREVMALLNRITRGSDPGAERDLDAERDLLERISPEVRIDMSRRVFNPDVYEGYVGLARLGREIGDVWADFRITPTQFVDAGDRVVVMETRAARGAGSGVEVEQHAAVIWTLRAGRVVCMETDFDPQEALAAVGLGE